MAQKSESICKDLESHHVHMCRLNAEGRTDMVECLSSKPQYKCGFCGAKANFPENICDPNQLPEQEWLGDAADNINLTGKPR